MIKYRKKTTQALTPIYIDNKNILIRTPKNLTFKANKIQFIPLELEFQIPSTEYILQIMTYEKNCPSWKILLNYAYPSLFNMYLSYVPVLSSKFLMLMAGDIICQFCLITTESLLTGKILKN